MSFKAPWMWLAILLLMLEMCHGAASVRSVASMRPHPRLRRTLAVTNAAIVGTNGTVNDTLHTSATDTERPLPLWMLPSNESITAPSNATSTGRGAPWVHGRESSTHTSWRMSYRGLEPIFLAIGLLMAFLIALAVQMAWDSGCCRRHKSHFDWEDDDSSTDTTISTCTSRHDAPSTK